MFKVEEWVLDYVVAFANLNISSTNKSWAKVILLRISSKFLPIFIRNMMCNVLWRWSNKVDPWH